MVWPFSLKKIFRFFVQEWRESRLYWANLSSLEKKEIQRNKIRYFVSLCVSILLHVGLVMSILNMALNPHKHSKEIEILKGEVDFELTEGMVSSDIQPVYDNEGEVIIKPSLLLKPEDKQAVALNDLLSQLKEGKGPALSSALQSHRLHRSHLEPATPASLAKKSLSAKLKVKGFKIPETKTQSKSAGFWNHIQMLKSDQADLADIDDSEIMKVIDQHSFQFRDCYEKALLKDEKLSVRAVFLLRLNQSQVQHTRLELNGTGNKASRHLLSHCLFRKMKMLVFAKNQQKLSLRFNMIFGL